MSFKLYDWLRKHERKLLNKTIKQREMEESNRQILFNKLKEELIEIACAEGYDVIGPDFERKIVLPNGAPIACTRPRHQLLYGRYSLLQHCER